MRYQITRVLALLGFALSISACGTTKVVDSTWDANTISELSSAKTEALVTLTDGTMRSGTLDVSADSIGVDDLKAHRRDVVSLSLTTTDHTRGLWSGFLVGGAFGAVVGGALVLNSGECSATQCAAAIAASSFVSGAIAGAVGGVGGVKRKTVYRLGSQVSVSLGPSGISLGAHFGR